MAVKIQKGGWILIFLVGVALVGYSLHKYGVIDLGHLMPSGSGTSSGSASVMLRLHGSNTIGAQLAPALAEAFLRQRGATEIRTIIRGPDEISVQGVLPDQSSPRSIEISAHGSSTAFADMRDSKCDIGASSRSIQPQEAASLSALGDMTSPAAEHVLGLDGIAVIVNGSNSVRSLSKDQIRGIFAGEITDWTQAGGAQPRPIAVYARDAKSGTWDTFKSLVLGDTPLAGSAQRIEDSRQLSDRVANDPNGIGFVGLAFVRNAKPVAVSEPGTRPVYPTNLTVATESYPLSRRLFLYTPPNPPNAVTRDFITFALSRMGQETVTQNGFVGQTVNPVGPEPLSPRDGNMTAQEAKYVRATQAAVRLPLDFRFRSGSSNLDNKALDDLERVSSFVASPQYAGQSMLLLGFADSSGSRESNDRLSADRARIVAEEFRTRGIKVAETAGFGPERPVASNNTAEGREKNRRVEVWLRRQ
ncbi:MAG TPA: phosphate ABC transporter substrate-binding/OmpA family protein [Candidatus Angelobacter sp.]|nr:phosphate ABC transporter substrate-binding/OmpA family protein [Candidatus Angelobacter sp.]